MALRRKFKYDDQQLEYFVETSDVVKIKKSDLERVIQAEEAVDPKDTCDS